MKYLILKASNIDYHEEVEVNTMEDLRAISFKHSRFIVDFNNMTIIIYDSYVE
jgi:hypothetical protein